MTDTFRMIYSPLSDGQKMHASEIKNIAQHLEAVIKDATTKLNGREMAVAQTNLETTIMWAVKGATKCE